MSGTQLTPRELEFKAIVEQNAAAIKVTCEHVLARCHELEAMVVAQNQKITTLDELARNLQRQVVMQSVAGRGSGPTVPEGG